MTSLESRTTDKTQSVSTWSMAKHALSNALFQHESHTFRGTSIRLNDEVREYLLQNADVLTVAQLRKTVRSRYNLFLEDSQVRYFLKSKNVQASESRAGRESGIGNALDEPSFRLCWYSKTRTLLHRAVPVCQVPV